MIYVGHPYSGSEELREVRYQIAMAYCAHLKKRGVVGIYAPIVHNHNLASIYGMPKTNEYWETENLHMLGLSRELHVLELEGHEDSFGLITEINHAKINNIPIANIPESFFMIGEIAKTGVEKWMTRHQQLTLA